MKERKRETRESERKKGKSATERNVTKRRKREMIINATNTFPY